MNNANQNIRPQRPGDTQINTGNFNNLVEKANANARQFGSGGNTGIWRKSGGSTVSAPLSEDPNLLQFHFQAIQVSKTDVEIHCGRGVRFAAGAINVIGLGKDGGGTSAEWEDVVTVTCNAAGYIKITYDDPLQPTTLTASFVSGAYPTTDTDYSDLFVAQIFWDASNSLITRIEQIYTGGDWYSQYMQTDAASLDYDDSGKLQQWNWDNASDDDIDLASDLISYKDQDSGDQQYVLGTTLAANIATYIEGQELLTWSSLSDTAGDPTQAANDGYIPIVYEYAPGEYRLELRDLGATGVGPFWVKGADQEDCYGEAIGKDDKAQVINLDNQQLVVSDGAAWTLDWLARQLDGADWTVLAGTILKISDTTPADSADGSVENQGGYYGAAGLYVDKGAADAAGRFYDGTHFAGFCDLVYAAEFTAGSLYARFADDDSSPNSAGALGDGTRVIRFADGTYAANATNGAINAQGGYYDNGTAGVDGWFDDGANFRITVSGGIITAIADSTSGGHS